MPEHMVLEQWLQFKGTARKTDFGYRLTAFDSNGIIDLSDEDVKIDGDTVEVKVGGTARIIKEATGEKPETLPKRSGCRRTQCVALVLICCDDGRILSACLGAWGCS